MRKNTRENLATLCLIVSGFLNPIGYTYLLGLTMNLTNSYWVAIFVFYCVAALFFGLYFLLHKNRIMLSLAVFFNPLGFDALTATLINLTGSFDTATNVLYVLTGSFFISFLLLSKTNPVKMIVSVFQKNK